ncbi:MAG: DUF5916 domain-containing protein [Saprospiraceae bacterium]
MSYHNYYPVLFLIFGWLPAALPAQTGSPDTIVASFTETKIRLDGLLDESIWGTAMRVSNFMQVEPVEGAPATERTEVAVVYTETALYLGVWCYDSEPDKLVAKFLERDFDAESDDLFAIALSTFNDKRNGYAFGINPNGARLDGLISGIEDINPDWNGVWDAIVKKNTKGWFAEIYIPFSTLQYRQGEEQTWGIKFQRNILRKNEFTRWQGWSRNFNFENLSQAGTLTGLKNIKGKVRLEVKPYGLAGVTKEKGIAADAVHKVGLDINKNLLSTLKLNLTVNTDFAQVEADRIQTNLSRFSLFYPEKREFFLEGAANYNFGLGGPNSLFYSRRIGISDDNQLLPIIAGTRVFGKANKTNIGLLSIQTGEKGGTPSTNYSMLRLRQDVGTQSGIGMIVTSKQNADENNLVFGADANYETAKFLKDKNLSIGGMVYGSHTRDVADVRNIGYRIFLDYPNDLVDYYMSTGYVPENFIPGMGFIFRKNYRSYVSFFRFTPRWFTGWGIRQMKFRPWGLLLFQNPRTGKVESWQNETRPLGFELQSGESFEFNIKHEYDHPEEGFDISEDLVIPAGEYHMHGYEIQIATYQGRRVFGSLTLYSGLFYTGDIKTIETELGVNVNTHLNLEGEWIFNDVQLPAGELKSHELSGRIIYAFTPRLNTSLFAQWNSAEDFIGFNFRIHWIPTIGSDLYFVINQGYENQLRFKRLQETSAAVKLVWRVAI